MMSPQSFRPPSPYVLASHFFRYTPSLHITRQIVANVFRLHILHNQYVKDQWNLFPASYLMWIWVLYLKDTGIHQQRKIYLI